MAEKVKRCLTRELNAMESRSRAKPSLSAFDTCTMPVHGMRTRFEIRRSTVLLISLDKEIDSHILPLA